MNHTRLQSIIQAASEDLIALAEEHEDDILHGIHAITQEAHNNDQEKVKVRLNFAIILDLGEDKQTSALSWTVSHKVEAEHRLPDPNQAELEAIVTESKTRKPRA